MNLNLRKATKSDLQKTFDWVNNEKIRRFSINSQLVRFESHEKWFLEKIESSETAYYLLENETGDRLGSIRFDLHQKNGKINYLLDPKYHGMGLGSCLLKYGIIQLEKDYPSICTVYGWVFKSNIASIKIFEKLQFRIGEQTNDMLRFEYQMKRNED